MAIDRAIAAWSISSRIVPGFAERPFDDTGGGLDHHAGQRAGLGIVADLALGRVRRILCRCRQRRSASELHQRL